MSKKPLPMRILGTGRSVPPTVRTNHDLAARLDTTDEWIVTRTGIRERRIAGPDQSASSLGAEAARAALDDAGLEPNEIDLILCATITGDCPFPATANFIQQRLGIAQCASFDIAAACSGFVYALVTGGTFLLTGAYRNILVVGTEVISRFVDQEDRTTCVIFGDGAGAAVIAAAADPSQQLLVHTLGVEAELTKLIWVPAGGSVEPASTRTVNERLHYMRMQGRDVFRYAVPKFVSLVQETLAAAEMTADDVAFIIPHQSNARIVDAARERLGWAPEKVVLNIERYGNTSAASIPIAFDELRREGRVGPGDVVLMLGIGAGVTYATALLRL